ncbi:cellulase family glycosylhydrolase [Mycobacterium adipatum]|uniref:cellulase family glycosylhydrolase n=1 Tax=Mycobacterium adipatum TaxID=1682113 RepID=UPI0034E0989F
MTSPTPLLRAKIAAGTVAAVTLASVLTATPAATATEALRPTYQMAVTLLSETSAAAPVFGVSDSHLYDLGPEELTERLTELRALGVTDLRVAVPWVYMEPVKGTYDWAKMDALVAKASEMGFTVTGAVTATPTWAGLPLAGAPNPDAYAAFAGSVAARYGSQISAYEIWNEPNGVIFYAPVNAAGYTEMLKAAYTAIKAANPDAVVLAGSLGATTDVYGISVTPQRFLSEMYAAGAAGHFDALSYHPYHFTLPFSAGSGTTNTPLEQVKALYDLMVANGDGDKQIWATEYGTATTPGWGVTQAEQAAFLRDFLTGWSKLSYTGPAFVYTSEDAHTGILNHEYNFGLFTSNGKPKLAAQVLAELIAASGLGELPDYTAPRMSAARDLYLQLASVGFGLANQALVIPNAAIAVIYNLMPGPLRRAFTAVANAVSAVVAQVAIAVTPVMQAALGLVVRALPQTPAPTPDATEDEADDTTPDLPQEAASSDDAGEQTGAPTIEAAVVVDDIDAEPVGVPAEDPIAGELVTISDPDTAQDPAVEPTVVEDSLTEPVEETEPASDPAAPIESDTEAEVVDSSAETETVRVDEPAGDTETEAEPDTKDTPSAGEGTDTETAADKGAEETLAGGTAAKSERFPRRAPRTAAAPSTDRPTSSAAQRSRNGDDNRSAPRGSGRDSSRVGSGSDE